MREGLPTRVSVIIPARNEEQFIEGAVRSLYANRSEDVEVELIVVDGDSDDSTPAILGKLEAEGMPLRIIRNEKRFTPVSMNMGIAASTGEFIILSGAHAEYQPDYIRTCLAVAAGHPEAWCVGGNIETRCDSVIGQAIADAMSSPFGVGNAMFRLGRHSGYVDTLTFGLYHRWVFDKVGLFDEELVRNQDDDMNLRILQAGGRLYMDERISCVYYSRSNLGQLYRQYFQYGYWRTRTLRKHGKVASFRQLVPALFVAALAVSGAAALFSPPARTCLAVFLAAYLLFLLAGAFSILKKFSFDSARYAPLIFFILHVAYGLGFWAGILDFATGRGPRDAHKAISR